MRSLNYAGTLAWVRSFAFTIRFLEFCAKPLGSQQRGPFPADLWMQAYAEGSTCSGSLNGGQEERAKEFPSPHGRQQRASSRAPPVPGW
jgi:hypothetical protein